MSQARKCSLQTRSLGTKPEGAAPAGRRVDKKGFSCALSYANGRHAPTFFYAPSALDGRVGKKDSRGRSSRRATLKSAQTVAKSLAPLSPENPASRAAPHHPCRFPTEQAD